ncbi:MAG TPA: Tol-Pal system beta propeller repeat protein TolB [Myxococcota bacterium]|jgi:TolB protein|nr:Tol-Pal system beta propeller repeat protein TolB [Myxococcota bacterium]
MPLRRLVLLALVLALLAGRARAQEENPTVVVTPSGEATRYKAAVQRFAGDAELALKLRQAIGEGLEFSSLFQIVNPQAFLGSDVSGPLDGGPPVVCPDWSQIGADALVEGVVVGRGETLAVEFRVWDVARCQKLERKRFSGKSGDLVFLGHKVADAVVAAFTGKPGVSATEVAFVSDRTGKREVYVTDVVGGTPKQLTHNNTINAFPGWSPDGSAIVYTSYREARRPYLFVLTRGSQSPGRVFRNLNPAWQVFRGVFDPTGSKLALVISIEGQSEIFSIDRNGSGLRRITNSPTLEVSPSYSPDGSQMVFVSDRTGAPQIYVMNADGSGIRRLTYNGSYNTGPAWSPDGKWIAYESQVGGQFDIWLIDPSGSANVPLATSPANDEGASWSPDGRKIVFASKRRGESDLYVVDRDGSNLRSITSGGRNNVDPAWGPYDRDLR